MHSPLIVLKEKTETSRWFSGSPYKYIPSYVFASWHCMHVSSSHGLYSIYIVMDICCMSTYSCGIRTLAAIGYGVTQTKLWFWSSSANRSEHFPLAALVSRSTLIINLCLAIVLPPFHYRFQVPTVPTVQQLCIWSRNIQSAKRWTMQVQTESFLG